MKGAGSWEQGNREGVGGGRMVEVREDMDGCLRVGGRPLPSRLKPLPSYLLRWLIKHDGIKQNKLTRLYRNMRGKKKKQEISLHGLHLPLLRSSP